MYTIYVQGKHTRIYYCRASTLEEAEIIANTIPGYIEVFRGMEQVLTQGGVAC